MTVVRVAFMGSPDFAVPSLEALIGGPFQPLVVVTQPDRPAGRGRKLRPPPVRLVADAAGIPILQPPRLREASATAALAAFAPDLLVVVAYGQILRPEVLALPEHGTLNVHASLLPRWRGAAPIPAAIRAGDQETGVTIMIMDEGVDTGAILAARPEPIHEDDDSAALGDRLAQAGAALLRETLTHWLAGRITPQPQDDTQATRAPQLHKEDGLIDWRQSAAEIARQVRAYSPWPGAWTRLRGTELRIWQAHAALASIDMTNSAVAGTVVGTGDSVAVATGEGVLQIETLQRAGRRRLDARAFSNGERNLPGARLGEPVP